MLARATRGQTILMWEAKISLEYIGMSFFVSAVVDDLSKVSGIRHDAESALKLALDYQRQGYSNIRVTSEDAVYTLEQFRMLVE